jgi:uncharacterized Ntn-hydrolase superfamily protein
MAFPSTFSIVAVDRAAGEVGVGVQSKFLSVGAAVPWVRAGVGAVATQAFCNTTFGPRGLDLLAAGKTPAEIVDLLIADDPGHADRQFGIVDVRGRSASYTGANCIEAAAGIVDEDFAVQGNCLASSAVVAAMADAFRGSSGHLADRIVAVLRAAQAAGGDKRGQQSAALIIEKPGGGYGGFNDRYVDLRVDDHATPIEELARLLEWHKLYFFAPEPGDIYPIDAALGTQIAMELARVGYLDAPPAEYDERVHRALVAFMHTENLENRERNDGAIDRQTLAYLRGFGR